MSTTPGSVIRKNCGPIFVPEIWLDRRIGIYPGDVIGPGNRRRRQADSVPEGHLQITKDAALSIIRHGTLELQTPNRRVPSSPFASAELPEPPPAATPLESGSAQTPEV